MKKFFLFLFLLFLPCAIEAKTPIPLAVDINAILASLASPTDVKAEELNIKEPKILPSSIWYQSKEMLRSVRLAFIRDKEKKASMLLRHANERLYEIKIFASQKKKKPEDLEKYFQKYIRDTTELHSVFNTLSEEEKQKIARTIYQQEFTRQKIFQIIHSKVKDPRVQKYQEESLKKFGEFLLSQKDAEKKLQEYIHTNIKFDASGLHDAKVLERLPGAVKDPKLKEKIVQSARFALQKLKESFEKMDIDDKIRILDEVYGRTSTSTPAFTPGAIYEEIQKEKKSLEKSLRKKVK